MAEINCYGVINSGYSDELRRCISKVPAHEPIELHISSPGGVLAEGVTCYNVLRRAPNEVIAYLDGDAFSAATLLVCSADYAEMPSNCLMMIHDPWLASLTPATIDEVTKVAKYLKATKRQVVDVYAEKTGKAKRALAKMMREETYLTAHEAMGAGFVHNVTGASSDVQNRPLDDYSNVRDKERLASMLGKRPIVRDLETLLNHIGV